MTNRHLISSTALHTFPCPVTTAIILKHGRRQPTRSVPGRWCPAGCSGLRSTTRHDVTEECLASRRKRKWERRTGKVTGTRGTRLMIRAGLGREGKGKKRKKKRRKQRFESFWKMALADLHWCSPGMVFLLGSSTSANALATNGQQRRKLDCILPQERT